MVNYKKELELAFGDYIEVYDGIEYTSKSQSILFIAMYPYCNSTVLWEFMNLKNKTRMHRLRWKVMVIMQHVIESWTHLMKKLQPAVNLDE
jgi:hypothetical protein